MKTSQKLGKVSPPRPHRPSQLLSLSSPLTTLLFCLLLTNSRSLGVDSAADADADKLSIFHTNLILKRFGGGDDEGFLNSTQLEQFLQSLPINKPKNPTSGTTGSSNSASKPTLTDCLALPPEAIWPNCTSKMTSCLKSEDMIKLTRGSTNRVDAVDAESISSLAPTILYQVNLFLVACYATL